MALSAERNPAVISQTANSSATIKSSDDPNNKLKLKSNEVVYLDPEIGCHDSNDYSARTKLRGVADGNYEITMNKKLLHHIHLRLSNFLLL